MGAREPKVNGFHPIFLKFYRKKWKKVYEEEALKQVSPSCWIGRGPNEVLSDPTQPTCFRIQSKHLLSHGR